MMRNRSRSRQAGFTLVELLIVIAIIALLVSLLMSGVLRVLAWQNRTETQTEITKMQDALQLAKTKYNNIEFLPSKLILHNDISKYRSSTATALEKQTATVLRYMFGRRFTTSATTVAWISGGATASVQLEGPECLVFYLGGMPGASGCTGFADDPLDPTKDQATEPKRIGPFYQFRATRLQIGPSGTFLQYRDPYGVQPYAYFGAYRDNPHPTYNSTDCATLGIAPYYVSGTSPQEYLNPKGFQIISAGPDRTFGVGGAWDPKNGSTDAATVDNLANFTQSTLGDPQS